MGSRAGGVAPGHTRAGADADRTGLAKLPPMILHPYESGFVAIPQSAHAFMAFQIAEHWGNRLTPRPSPRPEVLAAVLLHDAGWDGREEPPHLAPDGAPAAFDTIAAAERVPVWGSAVERARLRGRYVAYLVSHHVCALAAFDQEHRFDTFVAQQEALRSDLQRELASDARYATLFSSGADETNRAVVRLADAIAVHLARGGEGSALLEGVPRRGGSAPLVLRAVEPRAYRLRPWPLVGRRLTVTTEGRLLPARRYPDEAALQDAWQAATTVRVSWTLLPTGAPSD